MNREGKVVADNEGIDLKIVCRGCGSADLAPSGGNHDKLRKINGSWIVDIFDDGWLTCNNCRCTQYVGKDKEDKYEETRHAARRNSILRSR